MLSRVLYINPTCSNEIAKQDIPEYAKIASGSHKSNISKANQSKHKGSHPQPQNKLHVYHSTTIVLFGTFKMNMALRTGTLTLTNVIISETLSVNCDFDSLTTSKAMLFHF